MWFHPYIPLVVTENGKTTYHYGCGSNHVVTDRFLGIAEANALGFESVVILGKDDTEAEALKFMNSM